MDEKLYALAKAVGQVLNSKGILMATAESCTGGWVAKCMTDVPGSSAWFDSGFTVYNREAKQRMLNVPAAIIESNGEVSEATVHAMAQGAIAQSRASVSVAISGVAGPGDESDEKPHGTVWFAWCIAERVEGVIGHYRTTSFLEHFSGNRESVRRQAVATSLQGILDLMENNAAA
jgi:nicotinamide-nucleotide amidase